MPETTIPIILAIVLAGASFFSEHFAHLARRHFPKIVSLAAGVLTALVFVSFFPLVALASNVLPNIWFTVLAGFALYHFAEKWLYQHIEDPKKRMKDLVELNVLGFFIDHFITGIALALVFILQFEIEVVAIFIAFLLHTVTSSLSLRQIKHKFRLGTVGDVILSSGVVIGAVVAVLLSSFSPSVLQGVFGFSVGVFVYLVVRHVIPSDRRGSPTWFAIGLVITLAALLI